MVIMIIFFRDKTTTDYSDHADNKRKFRVSFLAQPKSSSGGNSDSEASKGSYL